MKRIFFLILVLVPSVAAADKTFTMGKGTTWDCKKDPIVSIAHGGGTYKLKGACTTINVSGGKNKLTIESVDELNLSGASNTVTVDTVGAINLVGAKNKVTWKAAKSGDAPAISHVGKDNVVTQAGGAAKPAAPTAPAAPPAAGPKAPPAPPPANPPAKPASGGIDCGKTASHVVTDNDLDLTYVGKCDKITLTGNDLRVKIESAKSVAVTGNEIKVAVDAAESILVSGNDNTVTYKKGISAAKPKLSNTGNDNKVSQVK